MSRGYPLASAGGLALAVGRPASACGRLERVWVGPSVPKSHIWHLRDGDSGPSPVESRVSFQFRLQSVASNPVMSLIHTCYRILEIDRSVDFYRALGFEEKGRIPIRDEAVNVFMGLPEDGDVAPARADPQLRSDRAL